MQFGLKCGDQSRKLHSGGLDRATESFLSLLGLAQIWGWGTPKFNMEERGKQRRDMREGLALLVLGSPFLISIYLFVFAASITTT